MLAFAVALGWGDGLGNVSAFAPHSEAHAPPRVGTARRGGSLVGGEYSSTALFRGAKKANKQMELAKKMALAKQQKQRDAEDAEGGGATDGQSASAASSASAGSMSDDEIKAENDRKRFDELLNSERSTAMFGFNTESGYLTREQEEEAATAGASRGRVDRLFEMDSAPSTPFEDIVNIRTENALGESGAKNLVPWLHKNTARNKDYLVVITDPREKSSELRQAITEVCKSLPKPILSKTIIINADAPPENRRWLKKNKLEEDVTIFSDEKREWMREYTALGETRWSMTLFILGDGKIQKLVREFDHDLAPTVVRNAVKSLDL